MTLLLLSIFRYWVACGPACFGNGMVESRPSLGVETVRFDTYSTRMACSHWLTCSGHSFVIGSAVGRIPKA